MKFRNNKRGSFELILVIPLVLFALLFLYMSYSSQKESNDGFNNLDLYSNQIMETIEKDGYITDEVKFDIEKFAENNNFSYTEISGTETKVGPGEKVHLKIEVYNKNLSGGILDHHKIFKEGISE